MIRFEKDKNEFQMLQKMEKTFYDLWNVHDCNNGISLNNCQEVTKVKVL